MMRSVYVAGFLGIVALAMLTPQTAHTLQDDETLKEQVKPRIEAGVEFLKRVHLNSGVWAYQGQNAPNNEQVVGATALCAVALLECDVPPNDRHIQSAVSVVRRAAADPNFKYTYSVCLSLILLDRLNKGKDVSRNPDAGTIKRLANLIVAGQSVDGRWGYTLPSGAVDNSNTQFAVVALWIARKYTRVDAALKRAEMKLRQSQTASGGWGYDASNIQMAMAPTGSMTCAGVLGLALHAGSMAERNASFRGQGAGDEAGDVYRRLEKDKAVAAARNFIWNALQPFASGQPQESHATYFLWSLERVATLYKWGKRDGFDWFPIGARYLMSQQQRDGSWNMDFLHGANVDTAFALLFLAKSNLLGELQEAEFSGKEGIDSSKMKEKKVEPKKETAKDKADELLKQLLEARLPDKQSELLNDLAQGRGVEYAEALVKAINQLSTNASKEMAREALAARFIRLTDKALQD
ncbi:MAG TPA: terpene cyclase/mutase family protein [Gemmatales bacterium]|nr:terpene cyclase/mutase family protein [Gemmatales bacterium]